MRTKKVYATVIVLLFLVSGVASTHPGQQTIKAALQKIGLLDTKPSPDIEKRAREKHGWDRKPILTSVIRGIITYFDGSGIAVQQLPITLYRKYPDQLRLEIERPRGQEISGVDGRDAWRASAVELRDTDARDIRGWSRIWPERLFVTRDEKAQYREVGRILDERARREPGPGKPGGSPQVQEPIVADQVEMEDEVGPMAAAPNDAKDLRRISYYVDSQTSLVYAARWLEPNNPSKHVDDRSSALMDVRVDFSRWTQVDGVIWPFQVIHQRGGKIDFTIQVTSVQTNQPIPDTAFQRQ